MIAGQFVKYGDRQVPLVVLGAEEATPLMKEEGALWAWGSILDGSKGKNTGDAG
jgi:hypothetical protein